MKKTHYRATFSDGTVREIKSSRREYSAAYRWNGSTDGFVRGTHGFSRTPELARRAMLADQRRQKPATIDFAEVVMVERVQ